MSASRRYEILLPLRFNDGRPVPAELIGETLQGLRLQFGAVTWETQTVRGQWHLRASCLKTTPCVLSLMLTTCLGTETSSAN